MAPALKRRLEELAARTEREVTELWRRSRTGLVDRDTFIELAAIVLARARAQGVLMADLSLSTAVALALGDVPAPIGISLPGDDLDRLVGSVRSVINEEVKTAVTPEQVDQSRGRRFARLGRDAPADAMTWAMGVAMVAHEKSSGLGVGWTRATSPTPCKVRANLADGVVRPGTVAMKRHTGCMCVQRTVVRGAA